MTLLSRRNKMYFAEMEAFTYRYFPLSDVMFLIFLSFRLMVGIS